MRNYSTNIATMLTAMALGLGISAANAKDEIPSKFIQDGAINVASSATSPPFVFFDKDATTIIGVDVEIANAIGKELNTKFKFSSLSGFGGIIPAIQAGRYPISLAAMTDKASRRETVDFVDYANVGLGMVVAAGNPKHIETLDDLCGATLATETGSSAIEIGNNQSKKCVAAGKPPVTVAIYPAEAQAQLQVKTGRADVNMHDYPVAIYTAENSGGTLAASKANFCKAPFGIAIKKGEPELLNAIKVGLDASIKNGEYQKILKKWDMDAVAIDKAVVNGEGLNKNVEDVCP